MTDRTYFCPGCGDHFSNETGTCPECGGEGHLG